MSKDGEGEGASKSAARTGRLSDEEMDEAQEESNETFASRVTTMPATEGERDELAELTRRSEPDLIKRAKALAGINAFEFAGKTITSNGVPTYVPDSSDGNRREAIRVVFGEGEERPHWEMFSGRCVDHRGVIIDDDYSMVEFERILAAAGLKAQSYKSIREVLREWSKAEKRNDMLKKFNARIPAWDGAPRIRRSLIELFETKEGKLNEDFSMYFWLSLYNRIVHPGWQAPMVLSLFGAQNAGKSYFSKRICECVMSLVDKPQASPVILNISGDNKDFLRKITGNSVVANIGEMTGFGKANLEDMKAFITATSDMMDYKFEGHHEQQRQWIVVMDGNTYAGLQRDSTGNRRFYPMFVGQMDDVAGQPFWKDAFSVDFNGFDDKFWQWMAECKEWMETDEDGEYRYNKMVEGVVRDVKAFSEREMKMDRGTVQDDDLDVFLIPALNLIKNREGEHAANPIRGTKNSGWFITSQQINDKLVLVSRNKINVKWKHLATKMAALGFEKKPIKNVQGYFLKDVMTEDGYLKQINGKDEEFQDAEVHSMSKEEQNGSF